jgi:hypothetical protein
MMSGKKPVVLYRARGFSGCLMDVCSAGAERLLIPMHLSCQAASPRSGVPGITKPVPDYCNMERALRLEPIFGQAPDSVLDKNQAGRYESRNSKQ